MYSTGLQVLKVNWQLINECELPQAHQQHQHDVGGRERLGRVKQTIEGFGGKRVLGFLLKSELCQKRSKFRM